MHSDHSRAWNPMPHWQTWGQALSIRADLLSPAYLEALTELQDGSRGRNGGRILIDVPKKILGGLERSKTTKVGKAWKTINILYIYRPILYRVEGSNNVGWNPLGLVNRILQFCLVFKTLSFVCFDESWKSSGHWDCVELMGLFLGVMWLSCLMASGQNVTFRGLMGLTAVGAWLPSWFETILSMSCRWNEMVLIRFHFVLSIPLLRDCHTQNLFK